jgi:hypothetical protein
MPFCNRRQKAKGKRQKAKGNRERGTSELGDLTLNPSGEGKIYTLELPKNIRRK